MRPVPSEVTEIEIVEEQADLTVKDQFWLGNTMTYWYRNHNPVFVLGPNCKNFQ